jgi:hypothetical protein
MAVTTRSMQKLYPEVKKTKPTNTAKTELVWAVNVWFSPAKDTQIRKNPSLTNERVF